MLPTAAHGLPHLLALSQPCCRYDVGGFSNLQGCDFEVDLSSAGLLNTALIAVFSKLGAALDHTLLSILPLRLLTRVCAHLLSPNLPAHRAQATALAGVPIKTAVAPHLLESAFEGRVQASPLPFGVPCSGAVRSTRLRRPLPACSTVLQPQPIVRSLRRCWACR